MFFFSCCFTRLLCHYSYGDTMPEFLSIDLCAIMPTILLSNSGYSLITTTASLPTDTCPHASSASTSRSLPTNYRAVEPSVAGSRFTSNVAADGVAWVSMFHLLFSELRANLFISVLSLLQLQAESKYRSIFKEAKTSRGETLTLFLSLCVG